MNVADLRPGMVLFLHDVKTVYRADQSKKKTTGIKYNISAISTW